MLAHKMARMAQKQQSSASGSACPVSYYQDRSAGDDICG
jgi:hypothetical protein